MTKEISLISLFTLIKQEEEKLSEIKDKIFKNALVTKDRELDGRETLLSEVEVIEELFISYNLLSNKIVNHKNKLNYYNTTTKVSGELSIIGAINTIKAFRSELNMLDSLSRKTPSLDRKFDGNGGSAYYRVIDLNFKLPNVNERRDFLNKEIARLDSLIQNANATTLVKIEI